MLSNDTKKIIDNARDTLVGQIPVPMMQCQQITLALTYKFMSDDDEQAVELGGQRHYFTGGLEKYGWDKIMSLRLDDTQRSELYRAGLSALQESDSMPAVFREIFKDAMVPYGDHRTLALFLNTMNGMVYDDSEKLGDAYEYLLKTAEAQADAGQFRTPRHIIDFIVNIINPQKHEVIIDPACGTAGFLVSSYQHVKSQHELPGGGTTLSIPDLTRLSDNLNGYDISPEMTKLAMANMYLHTQDKNPNIANYDTLTSTDHWNDYADVMLANPPFMTPKGGIRPHSRFRVAAKRAEVLFVDYIASHLNEHGRAGIIVPEGIIFQSQNAYRQLRRFLLDESLVAVISLPGGVFNPYSGVKTSILILDKVLAPKTDYVAFFKVENDGYDLGAQRRPIGKDDLPDVSDEINQYLHRLRAGESLDDFELQMGLLVDKDRVSDDGDYNLSGERYRESIPLLSRWRLVELKDCCSAILSGGTPSTAREDYWDGDIPWITSADIVDIKTALPRKYITDKAIQESATNLIKKGNLIVVTRVGLGKIFANDFDVCISQDSQGLIIKQGIDVNYLVWVLRDKVQEFKRTSQGSTIQGVTKKQLSEMQIPLPPLEVQREFVAEIEGYQRVMDGARAVVDNWQPWFTVDPDWSMVELGDLCTIVRGSSPRPKSDPRYYGGSVPRLMVADITRDGMYSIPQIDSLTEEGAAKSRPMKNGDVIVTVSGNPGLPTILAVDACIHDGFVGLRNINESVNREYLYLNLLQQHSINGAQSVGAVFKNLTTHQVKGFEIPLPSLEHQHAIVAELGEERAAVGQAERLAVKMEQRIQDAIARVWEG